MTLMSSNMIIAPLLCNLLLVKSTSSNEYLPRYKLAINKFQQNTDSISGDFSAVITNLVMKYTLKKHVLYLFASSDNEFFNQVMDNILQKLHRKSSFDVTLLDYHSCRYLGEEEADYNLGPIMYHFPSIYIIPFPPHQAPQCFKDQLELLTRRNDFNPKAIFIIIIFPGSWGNSNYSILFDILWSKNLFSTILLAITDGQLVAFWAKPYSITNKCRTTESGGIKYKSVKDLKEDSIDVYEENFASCYNGCSFLVGTIPRPPYVVGNRVTLNGRTNYVYKHGIEIELLNMLASKTNFTIEFSKTLSYDSDAIYSILPNGSRVGTLVDVRTQKIDATFGGLVPTYVVYHRYDYVFPHKVCKISFYLANAGRISPWKMVFIMFDIQVWTVSVSLFIVVAVVHCWFQRLMRRRHRGQTLNMLVFVEMLRINLGCPTILRPRSCSLRLLLFAWALYSMHWDLVYNTLLVALQANTPRDKEITTLEELLRSGQQVRVTQLIRGLMAPVRMDTTSTLLLQRSVKCSPAVCLDDFLAHRNFSLLTKTDTIENFVDLASHGIHSLSETLLTYSVAMVLSKGNPLTNRLQRLSLRALQAGLTNHWEIEAKRLTNKNRNPGVARVSTRPLSLSDLKGPFIILSYGLAFALVVFIIEIVVSHYYSDCPSHYTSRSGEAFKPAASDVSGSCRRSHNRTLAPNSFKSRPRI